MLLIFSICHRALVDNVEALSLVRECRELEERYKSNFTSEILNSNEPADRHHQKCTKDHQQERSIAAATKGLSLCTNIAECVGWKKLWDHALDHGPSVIKGMKNLVRVITYPDHSPRTKSTCIKLRNTNIHKHAFTHTPAPHTYTNTHPPTHTHTHTHTQPYKCSW